jgi:RimJ/RimL family protein N-acetyltransferase
MHETISESHHGGAAPNVVGQPAPRGYPTELARTALLRDGTPVFIRPIRPDDAPRLIDAYSRLSKQSAYQRFFTLRRRLPPDWARHFADVDYQGRLALVADRETVDEPELIGVARYESAQDHDLPEIALVVQDGWQGKGLGTLLLNEILGAGQSRGHRRFRALVLTDNNEMLTLLDRHTEIKERTIEDGVVALTFERREPSGKPSLAREGGERNQSDVEKRS